MNKLLKRFNPYVTRQYGWRPPFWTAFALFFTWRFADNLLSGDLLWIVDLLIMIAAAYNARCAVQRKALQMALKIKHIRINQMDETSTTRQFVFGDCKHCEREVFAPHQIALVTDCWLHYKGEDESGELPCDPRYTQGQKKRAEPSSWTLDRIHAWLDKT